ncbi:MAG: hypothetical protein PUE85_08750 [Firmicutes bacterium]|nr:hypothetical protein [Bacillota bacterium]
MKLYARIISALLVVFMIISTVACANNDGKVNEKDSDSSTSEVSPKDDIFSDYPDVNYNGKDFIINLCGVDEKQFAVDKDEAKEITSYACYKRDLAVSERFGITIKTNVDTSDTRAGHNNFVKYVKSNDFLYHISGGDVWLFSIPLMQDVLIDLMQLENISYGEEWWYPEINDMQTINGKIFGLAGSMDASIVQYLSVVFFNMDLLQDFGYQVQDVYDMVYNMEWHLDKFDEIIKPMYKDSNQSGDRDAEDIYGVFCPRSIACDPFPISCGGSVLSIDSAGGFVIKVDDERNVRALEKLCNIFYQNTGSFSDIDYYAGGEFVSGKSTFLFGYTNLAFTSMRQMKTAYGMLPYPMLDAEQDGYHSLVVDGLSEWFCGKTLPLEEYDFVSLIMDAYAKYTYYNVLPVYFDEALKNRYSEDPQTAKMVDLINESASFDISAMFGLDLDMYYIFRYSIEENDTNLLKRVDRRRKAYNSYMKKVYALYE